MDHLLMKSIISTDYTEIESQAHIDEILSCHSTLDERTMDSLNFDKENFITVLDSYLKKNHSDLKNESSCICYENPIFKSQSTMIEYFSGREHIEKHLCERCGYVFSETSNRQLPTY